MVARHLLFAGEVHARRHARAGANLDRRAVCHLEVDHDFVQVLFVNRDARDATHVDAVQLDLRVYKEWILSTID